MPAVDRQKKAFGEMVADVVFGEVCLVFEFGDLGCDLFNGGIVALFKGIEKAGSRWTQPETFSICACKEQMGSVQKD